MPKEVVVTALTNRIEYATTDGKGLITGKREDITQQAIDAVFAYLRTEFNEKNSEGKGYGRNFGSYGRLMYLAPETKIIWEDNNKN